MPSNLAIAAFVFGAILLLIAILGGRFGIFGAEVRGTASRASRAVSAVLGVALIGLAVRMSTSPDSVTPDRSDSGGAVSNRAGGSSAATSDTSPPGRLRSVSSGQEVLRGSYTLDLDTGAVGGDSSQHDLFWRLDDDNTRYLEAGNGAAFCLIGASDLDRVADGDLLTSHYEINRLNGSPNAANQIPSGTVVLVKTQLGRYAKVRIEQYGIAAPGDLPEWPKSSLLIRWVTYAKP